VVVSTFDGGRRLALDAAIGVLAAAIAPGGGRRSSSSCSSPQLPPRWSASLSCPSGRLRLLGAVDSLFATRTVRDGEAVGDLRESASKDVERGRRPARPGRSSAACGSTASCMAAVVDMILDQIRSCDLFVRLSLRRCARRRAWPS
jgi:hypothetical protein